MRADLEKEFDKVLADITPYLIFAPTIFRNELVEIVKHMFTESTSNNREHFIELKDAIEKKIETRDGFRNDMEEKIFSFNNRWKTFNNRLIAIESNCFQLEIEVEKIKKTMKKRIATSGNPFHKSRKKFEISRENLPLCPVCGTADHCSRSFNYYKKNGEVNTKIVCLKGLEGCGKVIGYEAVPADWVKKIK